MKMDYRLDEPLEKKTIIDVNTAQLVMIDDPSSFQLQTILINSAYYIRDGKEYRFLLCRAREAGLQTELTKAA